MVNYMYMYVATPSDICHGAPESNQALYSQQGRPEYFGLESREVY